jgi:hypothetical protein
MMFEDEKGIHFDVENFWDNDVSTVLQRWWDKVGDEEAEKAIASISARWEEYVNKNKVEEDTQVKIGLSIREEATSENEIRYAITRQLLFVEIKGGKMESFLDNIILEIQEEEQKIADELESLKQESAPSAQTPEPDREENRTEALEKATPPETAPSTLTQEYLTDEYCLKRLVDTGFIIINKYSKHKDGGDKYIEKLPYSALDVFDELEKFTGSGLRARSIMMQYMQQTTNSLNKYRPKHKLKN